MKTFITDGFDKSDFEKLITGLVYLILCIAIVYVFIKHRHSDYNIIGAFIGAGGLFVMRKFGSYYLQSKTQPLSPIQDQNEYMNEPNQQNQNPPQSY